MPMGAEDARVAVAVAETEEVPGGVQQLELPPPPAARARMSNDAIMRAAARIMADGPRLAGCPLEHVLEHFAGRYPDLYSSYPHLLVACCRAAVASANEGGGAQRAEFLRQLRFMVERLADIDGARASADAATDAVHGMLNTRYVAPALERAERARLAREATAR